MSLTFKEITACKAAKDRLATITQIKIFNTIIEVSKESINKLDIR